MGSPWFNSLIFAISCLGGSGVVFSLWLAVAGGRATGRALALQWLLAVVAAAAAVFAALAMTAGQPRAIWGSAAVVAALYALLVVLPSPRFARCMTILAQLARHRHSRRAAMLAVPAVCPFLALALVYAEIEVIAEFSEESITAGQIALAEPIGELDSPLTTDLGRPIRILQMPADTCAPSTAPARLAYQDRLLTSRELHDMVIHQPLGWGNTNCHGFVFTAGRHWLGGAQVDAILEDNGYQRVDGPRADDIAVYRDEQGMVLHSGIVRGLASDGVILIESKWGQGGRFVHRHDRQPYAGTCTFYRSERQGHLLRGLYPGAPEDQPAVPSPSLPPTPRNAVVGL